MNHDETLHAHQSEPLLIDLCERGRVPDSLLRFGIRRLVHARLKGEYAGGTERWHERFARRIEALRTSPIALHTDKANEQHYEVPPAFFAAALGRHLKYSSCYWDASTDNLDQAEARMLALTCERAELADGQHILELGCGWGSLTLWMAAHYPNSRITAVSNSAPQRRHILTQCENRGLRNVEVITADVNSLSLDRDFDRVVSVEMFEHMRNYAVLLNRIAGWLKPDGRLFVHIFCHREVMYPFEVSGEDDWMGRHFFTGGLMPAADTLLHFQDDLTLERRWRMSGTHYEKTANAWLAHMDGEPAAVRAALANTYPDADLDRWIQRWRMFFMACAELFGLDHGEQYLVCHYRFSKGTQDGHGSRQDHGD